MKKNFFITCLLICSSSVFYAQSFFRTANYGRPSTNNKADFISPFNPYFGASGGYIFGGEGSVSNNIFSTGTIQLPIIVNDDNSFVFPLITNIADLKSKINLETFESIDSSLNDILGSEKGLSLGLMPAYKVEKLDNLVFYLGLFGKYNKFQSTENQENVQGLLQFRFGGGLEYGFIDIPDSGGAKRFIISATPVFSFLNKADLENLFIENESNYFSVEFSAIFTLKPGYGLLAEYVHGNDLDSRIKIGGVIAIQ